MENLSSFMSESNQNFIVKSHAEVTDAVVIVEEHAKDKTATESSTQGYVVVGEMCGLAVLRGAQVFSPGILCVSPPHLQKGDMVSILADVRGQCLRGSKTFSGDLCCVGEGVLNVTRDEIFRSNVPVTGVGVTVTKKMFPCPSLNESSFSGMFMLQNLPSIIAVDVLGT